jgi:hypothetical protein
MDNATWNAHGYRNLMYDLMGTLPIRTDTWQAINVRGSKAHDMHELEDITIYVPNVLTTRSSPLMGPDLPWAEDHFLERVSGVPLNPPPSAQYWPFGFRGNSDHTNAGKYDHTNPERFWPKYAGPNRGLIDPTVHIPGPRGIRLDYGALSDLVALLVRDRGTRQAYLPVWFPEDTGAHKKGKPIRVPCTLGYHFMIRNGKLSCRYYIRSCDAWRHLNNDIYMACRLVQWVADAVNHYTALDYDECRLPISPLPPDITPGHLVMHIASLHLFVTDVPKLKARMQ